MNRITPYLVWMSAMTLYLATMAPDLTWSHHGADSGDLVTAAYNLGVPHPSGYPLYVLLGKAFTLLPLGTIGWRLNLMSGVMAASAVALLSAWLRQWLRQQDWIASGFSALIAASASLALAASPLFWSQAIIAEVYALNALFVVVILYLTWRWQQTGQLRLLLWLAILYGLGLGNHLSLILLAPATVYLLGQRCPQKTQTYMAGLGLLGGLAIYAYLPWRAQANPFPNWGGADTWAGFSWLVSGALYRHYLFALPWDHLPMRVGAWAGAWVQQFSPIGAAISLSGFWSMWQSPKLQRWAIGAILIIAAYSVYAIGYNTADSLVYLIPAYIAWTIGLAMGAATLLQQLAHTQPKRLPLGAAALCMALLLPITWNWGQISLRRDQVATNYVHSIASTLPADALLISGADTHTFGLWYGQQVNGQRPDLIIVDRDLLPYSWYRDTLRQHYPALALPNETTTESELVQALIAVNLPQREVWLLDPDPDLAKWFTLQQTDIAIRILPQ